MSRIDTKFQILKKQGKKAFIAFITAGDPSLKKTQELVLAFEQSSVDIVELGVPFSDPLADGPTIQQASVRSLKKGTTLSKVLDTVAAIRKKSDVPVALMTYYNPVYHYGEEKFVRDAKKCGVDGLIIPDLPPEEASSLRPLAQKADLSLVFFAAPTTTPARLKKVAAASTGFIYYVSLTGVTGARKQLAIAVNQQLRDIKKITKKPVCVGFGISTPEHVKSLGKTADGIIVGSAIVKRIERHAKDKNLVPKTARFVKSLIAGLR